jgi:hypothetical protein
VTIRFSRDFEARSRNYGQLWTAPDSSGSGRAEVGIWASQSHVQPRLLGSFSKLEFIRGSQRREKKLDTLLKNKEESQRERTEKRKNE